MPSRVAFYDRAAARQNHSAGWGRGAGAEAEFFGVAPGAYTGADRNRDGKFLLAEEVKDANIQVNCMDPGVTYTNMTDEIVRAGDAAGWREVQTATEVRGNGGTAPDKQLQLAMFLASDRSNHISGRLISVDDDWKKLENSNLQPNLFTLRRVTKGATVQAGQKPQRATRSAVLR